MYGQNLVGIGFYIINTSVRKTLF